MYILTLLILNSVVIFLIALTLKQLGYWGSNKISNKVQKDVKKEHALLKRKQSVFKILNMLERFADNYGFIDQYELLRYKMYIQRLDIRVPIVNTLVTAKQIKGLFKLLNLLGLFLVLSLFVTTGSFISLLPLALVFSSKIFELLAKGIIIDQDKKIEAHFPEFYFSIYPYLTKGKNIRLTTGLRDFLKSRDTPRGRSQMKHLLIFVEDFLKLIDLYDEDLRALKELRGKYSFVTFINFSNIAAQALDGVDNRDKLLNFRIELQRKNRIRIEANAQKKIQWGTWATYTIIAIMLQFIVIMLYLKFAIMQGM